MRSLMIALVAVAPFAAACGASFPAPTQRLADAEAAERSAREVGADAQPTAKLEVKLAQEQIAKAKILVSKDNSEDNQRAELVLTRAQADAELGLALARENNAKVETQKAVEQARTTFNANAQGARP